jgi:hypothetical protein
MGDFRKCLARARKIFDLRKYFGENKNAIFANLLIIKVLYFWRLSQMFFGIILCLID